MKTYWATSRQVAGAEVSKTDQKTSYVVAKMNGPHKVPSDVMRVTLMGYIVAMTTLVPVGGLAVHLKIFYHLAGESQQVTSYQSGVS